MINPFYELKELKKTGLKMIGSYIWDGDISIGERYLQPEVISRWDFKDYSDYYTYFDRQIKFVVNLCYRKDEKTTRFEHLKKDLSNIPDEQCFCQSYYDDKGELKDCTCEKCENQSKGKIKYDNTRN